MSKRSKVIIILVFAIILLVITTATLFLFSNYEEPYSEPPTTGNYQTFGNISINTDRKFISYRLYNLAVGVISEESGDPREGSSGDTELEIFYFKNALKKGTVEEIMKDKFLCEAINFCSSEKKDATFKLKNGIKVLKYVYIRDRSNDEYKEQPEEIDDGIEYLLTYKNDIYTIKYNKYNISDLEEREMDNMIKTIRINNDFKDFRDDSKDYSRNINEIKFLNNNILRYKKLKMKLNDKYWLYNSSRQIIYNNENLISIQYEVKNEKTDLKRKYNELSKGQRYGHYIVIDKDYKETDSYELNYTLYDHFTSFYIAPKIPEIETSLYRISIDGTDINANTKVFKKMIDTVEFCKNDCDSDNCTCEKD